MSKIDPTELHQRIAAIKLHANTNHSPANQVFTGPAKLVLGATAVCGFMAGRFALDGSWLIAGAAFVGSLICLVVFAGLLGARAADPKAVALLLARLDRLGDQFDAAPEVAASAITLASAVRQAQSDQGGSLARVQFAQVARYTTLLAAAAPSDLTPELA